MSDSYLGLDQQYDIRLDVIPAPETAVNGDVDDSQFIWQSVFNWLLKVNAQSTSMQLYAAESW